MLKLTRKLLEKYFGVDSSKGYTCDCKECMIINQILEDQEYARCWREHFE